MTVVPPDSRQPTTAFGTFPLNAVVAVDSQFPGNPTIGSGITIAPNHVLTAGHNAYSTQTATNVTSLRTTTSANQPALNSRTIGAAGDPAANVVAGGIYFPKNFNTTGSQNDDIALFNTADAPIAAANTVGLIAFVDNSSAQGLSINTAGYPGDIGNGRILVNSPGTGSGSIVGTNGDRFYYSDDVDTFGGQSGSGVWHTLNGDTAPRVLGVHTNGINGLASNASNSGTLITTDTYNKLIAQVASNSGTSNGNDLPENAIIGSDPGFFSFLTGSGNDNIVGSYRKERILGNGGDDKIFGGGGDDRLEGGTGVDQALFSDVFTNYTFKITDPANPAFEFDHTQGTKADGKDSTKDIEFAVFEYVDANNDQVDDDGNLFFVPLQVDPNNNTKLKDGPQIDPFKDIVDSQGNKVGTITVESPAWTFDGDVDYRLAIGSRQGTLFNFVYIIDTSGSMFGEPLAQAKAAYQALTQSLIDKGIAASSEFAVVPFNSSASITGPIDANTAISTINSLSAGGGTSFGPALAQAQQFFQSRNNNATNIAYFLSDGFGDGASDSLQSVAEVRAFGIGGADLTSLDIIDSDNAVLLTNPADLVGQFSAATVNRDSIARIDVKLGGTVVSTITPDQLVVDALGRLTFDGSIDKLTVGRTAENNIDFDVVFKDSTPTTTLSYKITSGQEQVTTQTADGTREIITFSVNQSDFTESATTNIPGRQINGNDLDNTITVSSGNNTLLGNGGDDRFILNGGTNLVDGGAGRDTVKINKNRADAGNITQNGNVTNIGSDITLLNIEFIEFNDLRLSTTGLTIVPVLSLANREISIVEGNSGSKTATFQVNLSTATTKDVSIDYATRSRNAQAGTDFTESKGTLTIAAGQSSGTIDVVVLGDTLVEGDEQVFLDLTATSGETFADGQNRATAGLNITDDESSINLSFVADDPSLPEGNPGQPATLRLTLDRFGNLTGSDTVEVQVLAGGSNPAQATDLVNGFSTSQVTFAAGERTKQIEIPIAPDLDVEGDETFGVQLRSLSGSAAVPTGDLVFTIRNDDGVNPNPNPNPTGSIITGTPARDTLVGTSGNDQIFGLDDNDIINAQQGDDTVVGDGGDDTVFGGDGKDRLSGRDGNDIIDGENGDDAIFGELGDDSLYGANDQDTLFGGDGNDYLNGGYGDDVMDGENGNDFLFGDLGNDSLYGANDQDTLFGGDGNDYLNGGYGDDVMDGENGNDFLFGDLGNDSLYGANGQDTLQGGDGRDVLNGGDGDDLLSGGAGIDTLTGGAGADTFQGYLPATGQAAEPDLILDFQAGTDKIELSRSIFTALGNVAGSVLPISDFVVVANDAAAALAPAAIVYNSTTGLLSYRPMDGGLVAVAQFSSNPLLGSSDFTVV